ncbi:hypothetical protein [Nonomuraea sp. NPDC050786]|uniref:hypothetical protein n=1 Tax=Nonomuraea sp. NPDC050786 TaxID=3154840 RepID=UPI0033E3DF3D
MKTRTVATVLAMCLTIGACKSGTFEGPDAGDRPDGASTRAGQQDPPAGKQRTKYGFTLPVGNTAVDVHEGAVYDELTDGDCSGAQTALDENKENFSNPEANVPLFQAGVYLCRKDVAAAKSEYAKVVWTESEIWFICEMHRAVGTVVKQKPKSAFGGCPPVLPLTPGPEDSPDPAESPDPASTPDPESTPDTESTPDPGQTPDSGETPDAGSGTDTGSGSGSGS